MGETTIEWTDVSWNPVRGFSRVSPGCEHCYAEVMAARFSNPGDWGHGLAERTPQGGRWLRVLRPMPDRLDLPLHWRIPRKVFVNSTSDLFHEDVPDEFIAAVFGVMAACPQHTLQVLTKRAERMEAWTRWLVERSRRTGLAPDFLCQMAALNHGVSVPVHEIKGTPKSYPWPLPNVHLGVSVENQEYADKRIPHLLRCPAAVRFLSVEPMLGPVDLKLHEEVWASSSASSHRKDYLHWVIVGGESGGGARPFDLAWARGIVAQCKSAGVACFVKQLGANSTLDGQPRAVPLINKKGGDMAEWPPDLRVREMPVVRR